MVVVVVFPIYLGKTISKIISGHIKIIFKVQKTFVF